VRCRRQPSASAASRPASSSLLSSSPSTMQVPPWPGGAVGAGERVRWRPASAGSKGTALRRRMRERPGVSHVADRSTAATDAKLSGRGAHRNALNKARGSCMRRNEGW